MIPDATALAFDAGGATYAGAVWLALRGRSFAHEGAARCAAKFAALDAFTHDRLVVGNLNALRRGRLPRRALLTDDIPSPPRDDDDSEPAPCLVDLERVLARMKPADRARIRAVVHAGSVRAAWRAGAGDRGTLASAVARAGVIARNERRAA